MSSSSYSSSGSSSSSSSYSSSSSSSSSKPVVNLYFNITPSSSDGKKYVREGSNQILPLAITRNGGDMTQSLLVPYQRGGTAVYGSDYIYASSESYSSSQGSQSNGFAAVIPAGAYAIQNYYTIIDDDIPEPTKTITATLFPASWYSIGSQGTDIVYLLDNDVKVTNVEIEIQLQMQFDSGVGPIPLGEVTSSGVIAQQINFEGTANAFLEAFGMLLSQMIVEFGSGFLRMLGGILGSLSIPSFWVTKMNSHLEYVGVSESSIIITYDVGSQQGLTHTISGVTNSTNVHSALIPMGELVQTPAGLDYLQSLLDAEGKGIYNKLIQQAKNWLKGQYPNHEIHGLN